VLPLLCLNPPFLFGSTEKIPGRMAKEAPSLADFGNCHAHSPATVFSRLLPIRSRVSGSPIPHVNPKKWENPEISTG
jgi:hypothetical protein